MNRAERRAVLAADAPMSASQMEIAWDAALARKLAKQVKRAQAIRTTTTKTT